MYDSSNFVVAGFFGHGLLQREFFLREVVLQLLSHIVVDFKLFNHGSFPYIVFPCTKY